MKLRGIFSFCSSAHYHAKIFRLNGFYYFLQALTLIRGMYLTRNRNNIVEGSNDYETAGKRDLATEPWAFGGNGLFEDLYKNVWFAAEHFIDLARFYNLRFYLECAKVKRVVFGIINRVLCELEQ